MALPRTDFSVIVDAIGKTNANILVQIAGGTYTTIPKTLKPDKYEIKLLYLEGKTYEELAEQFGYSERWIRDIVNK